MSQSKMERINSYIHSNFNVLILVGLFAVMAFSLKLFKKYRKVSNTLNSLAGVKTGILGDLFNMRNKSQDKVLASSNTYILEYLCGVAKMFPNEIMFRVWLAWRPVVVLYKPESVEALLTHSKNLTKGKDYDFLHTWLGTGLLTSTGDKWFSRRKILTPTFHFNILKEFLPVFNDKSQIFVEQLKSATEKQFVDICPLVGLLTLDIICESAMGVTINAQTNSNSEYVTAVKRISILFIYRFMRPWLWNEYIYGLSSTGREYAKVLNILKSFTRQVIKERKQLTLKKLDSDKNDTLEIIDSIKKRKAFLDLLLDIHIKDKSLSEEDIQEEVDTFMFEGHDTTSVGISFAMYNIGLYPEVQERLYEELYSIFGSDKTRPVTSDDLAQMKYLECVIKESQRLYPSVPAIGRILDEDLVIGKQVIPKGIECYVYVYGLHRNPDIYPNPDIFNPDRFLPENLNGRHSFAYIPFSGGKRNCIGQKFALMEEKTVLANVLRNYSLRSLDHRDKIFVVNELVLRPVNPLRIKITERI